MNFERAVIRLALYALALAVVLAIALYFGVYPSSVDIALALVIGLAVSFWEAW